MSWACFTFSVLLLKLCKPAKKLVPSGYLKKNRIILPLKCKKYISKNIYGAKKLKNGDRDIKISEQQAYGPERRLELRISIL
jgi:hypothetical protein